MERKIEVLRTIHTVVDKKFGKVSEGPAGLQGTEFLRVLVALREEGWVQLNIPDEATVALTAMGMMRLLEWDWGREAE